MTDENTSLPERIYLQPDCCVDWSGEGRQWCEDDVWGDDCPDHSPAIEYTRKALAAQPRDDVRELLREAQISIASAMGLGLDGELTDEPLKQPTADDDITLLARIDTALSQGDEQPAIPDMTDAECATAYRDLRRRANDAGFATVGEWIDEQPDTDGLAEELEGLASKATPAPWGIWFEQINGQADNAINELIEQVHSTHPIGDSLVMLDAGGKCPAITGCGPTSSYNAALITALVNNLPTILTAIRTDRKAVLEEAAKDFRSRARICRTNDIAFDLTAASVWDAAADALETKHAR